MHNGMKVDNHLFGDSTQIVYLVEEIDICLNENL